MKDETSNIPWHPAFVEAIQLELEDYGDSLEFHAEYQLTAEPLRIDCVVVKKTKDVAIKKNIAAIFREVNLLEYKSPDDYVSVADFYKVYGYACLYSSLVEVPITSLTVTFVESHYPRDLISHLREVRGYKVEEKQPGIYTVSGDILPIQVIDSGKLSADENLWLKDLDNGLDPPGLQRVIDEIYRKGKASRIRTYLDAITKANKDSLQEAIKVSDTGLTLDQIFEEAGLVAKWEERKALSIAKNMVELGYSIEDIVSATSLDAEKVKGLSDKNETATTQ